MQKDSKRQIKSTLEFQKQSPKNQKQPRGGLWTQWLAANATALGLSSKETKKALLAKPFGEVVSERGLVRVNVLSDIRLHLVGFFREKTVAAGRIAAQLVRPVQAIKSIDVIANKQARRAP